MQDWTFGRRIGAGLGLLVLTTLMVASIAIWALRGVVAIGDRVVVEEARGLIDAENMEILVEKRAAALRAFLLTREEHFAQEKAEIRKAFEDLLARARAGQRGEEARILEELTAVEHDYTTDAEHMLALARSGATAEVISQEWARVMRPRYEALIGGLDRLEAAQETSLEASRQAARQRAGEVTTLLVGVSVVGVAITAILAAWLTRMLTTRVGSAVSHLTTSATELTASASQQAATSKEQSTATNEVTTTMKELLATSRQIGESTRTVVRMAEETGGAADSGAAMLKKGREGMDTIKRKVDEIVAHMLDLGRKSQQIGVVLEIIDELAEQTNILAINATIEAAGAGEAGRRFSVVADEIRKLADRVGGSTREIRGLVDEIRASANTTVMATEQGTKAADAGIAQFQELTTGFERIAGLVVDMIEAAREIELSTRQQTTAVEQVSAAMGEVATSAGELETSSRQTVQVAAQLADLARNLSRMVEARRMEARAA